MEHVRTLSRILSHISSMPFYLFGENIHHLGSSSALSEVSAKFSCPITKSLISWALVQQEARKATKAFFGSDFICLLPSFKCVCLLNWRHLSTSKNRYKALGSLLKLDCLLHHGSAPLSSLPYWVISTGGSISITTNCLFSIRQGS